MPSRLPPQVKLRRATQSGRFRGQSVARRQAPGRDDILSNTSGSGAPRSPLESEVHSRRPSNTATLNSNASFSTQGAPNEGIPRSMSLASFAAREGAQLPPAPERRQRSLTAINSAPTAPREDQIVNEDLEAIFWVRTTTSATKLPTAPKLETDTKWKRRLVRLCLHCEHESAAALEIFAIKQIGETDGACVELKDDLSRLSIPLQKLELVKKGHIDEKKPLEFVFEIPETKKIGREFKYGQIMLALHFRDVSFLKGPLELACASTAERDAWYDWFTAYILHCELRAVRFEQDEPPEVHERLLGEPPPAGVAKFVNSFIAGAKLAKKEEEKAAEPLDIRKPPHKGQVLVRINQEVFERRKLSCTQLGRLTITGGIGVPKEHIDLSTSLVTVDTPWGGIFFIRLSITAMQQLTSASSSKKFPFIHDNRIELGAIVPEERAKVVEWILHCKGAEQSHDETFPYEAKERRELEDDEQLSEQGMRTSQSFATGLGSGSASGGSWRAGSGDADSVSDRGGGATVITGSYSRTLDSSSAKSSQSRAAMEAPADPLLALPITDEEELCLVLGPPGDIPGTWAFVEFNAIGGLPSERTAFARRMACFDSVARRVVVLQDAQPSSAVVIDAHLDDVFAVSGYSRVYGMAGLTIHCRQGVEVHIVPEGSALQAQKPPPPPPPSVFGSSGSGAAPLAAAAAADRWEKLRWLEALKTAGAAFAEEKSREEVNDHWLTEQRDNYAAMCGGGDEFDAPAAATDASEALVQEKQRRAMRQIISPAARAPLCRLTGADKSRTPICTATGGVYRTFLSCVAAAANDEKSLAQLLPPRTVAPSRCAAEVIADTERLLAAAEDARRAVMNRIEHPTATAQMQVEG